MVKHLAVIAMLALAVPAQAQEARVDPDHIMTLLKDAGYPAEYFNDDDDYRQILSKSGDYQFLVEMYDCVDGKACQTLEFYSNFPMEDAPTKQQLDAYSGPREGARIMLDRRGDAVIKQELDINVEGGLSDAQFIERVKHWETMLTGFGKFLIEPPAAAPATSAAAGAATEAAASTDTDAS
jgi:hypothetical protein